MLNKLIANTERYGVSVTMQDAWKFLALLLMIIDHVGFYFHPVHEEWFRAIGRLSAPIWFFFIGFAPPSLKRSQGVQRELWVLMGVMLAVDMLTVQPLFPLSILLSIMVARYMMHYWFMKQQADVLFVCVFLAKCLIVMLPTMMIWEYGSAVFGFCALGYYVKRGVPLSVLLILALGTVAIYMLQQYILFPKIAIYQWVVITLLLIGGLISLWHMPHATPHTWLQQPHLSYTVRFLARNSLYVYVAHCLLFQIIVWMLHPPQSWRISAF
ncbi:MAG: hypothetical protein EAY65_06665 [Alphaproteobacteria bacterium]|nr:MAG: hypothetical protein EAY65_06665 [Alphaproteobacteria bacterium]